MSKIYQKLFPRRKNAVWCQAVCNVVFKRTTHAISEGITHIIPEGTTCVIPEGATNVIPESRSRESRFCETAKRLILPTKTLAHDGMSAERLILTNPAGRQTLAHDGAGMKRTCVAGFTLIELLVVVLIIGILAAIALPQYEKAVMKSRMAAAIPIAKSIKDNLMMFRLVEGRYPTKAEFPDMVDFGNKTCAESGSTCRVGNYLIDYYSPGHYPTVAVIYVPGSGMSVASNAELIGAGVVPTSHINPKLACVSNYDSPSFKSYQVCSSYPKANYAWVSPTFGTVQFFLIQ